MTKRKEAENLIRDMITEESSLYMKDARELIKSSLKSATLSLLGLEGSVHRGYEIDHCNSRNSVLIDAFRNIAIEEATKIASTYQPDQKDIAGFKSAFRSEYQRQISSAIRDEARSKAKEDARKFCDRIKVDTEKYILEMKK